MANVTSTWIGKYVVPVDSITFAGRMIASSNEDQFLGAWIDTGMFTSVVAVSCHLFLEFNLCISIDLGTTYWNAPEEMWLEFYSSIDGPGLAFRNGVLHGVLPVSPQGEVNVSISIGGKAFVMDYNSLM